MATKIIYKDKSLFDYTFNTFCNSKIQERQISDARTDKINDAGALCTITGVAESNAISFCRTSGENKGTITELDHHKLFEPVTQWSSLLWKDR